MEFYVMPLQRASRIDFRKRIYDSRMWLALLILALAPVGLISQERTGSAIISVDLSRPGGPISPEMFGVFFEDINFAADGGLYPELVKNRSFEFNQPLNGWHEVLTFNAKGLASATGELAIKTEDPLNASNPHYLRARVWEPGYGFWNSG